MTLIDTKEPAPLHLIIGPEGQSLTLDDLPPPNTKRWVTKRKAIVVACVRAELLTLEEACERYTLSPEEFESWRNLIERHGIPGLRATRIQHYRPKWTPPEKPVIKKPILRTKNYLRLVHETEAHVERL